MPLSVNWITMKLSRAITILNNGSHYLQKYFNHTHAPQASSGNIAKTIADIKQQALATRDQLIQIIQNNIINISKETASNMPS
ncbi:676_t:CDS:2 [Funneliformis geosporum]|nr:676_t:CDS:2 [Funneliformis geosporum]